MPCVLPRDAFRAAFPRSPAPRPQADRGTACSRRALARCTTCATGSTSPKSAGIVPTGRPSNDSSASPPLLVLPSRLAFPKWIGADIAARRNPAHRLTASLALARVPDRRHSQILRLWPERRGDLRCLPRHAEVAGRRFLSRGQSRPQQGVGTGLYLVGAEHPERRNAFRTSGRRRVGPRRPEHPLRTLGAGAFDIGGRREYQAVPSRVRITQVVDRVDSPFEGEEGDEVR